MTVDEQAIAFVVDLLGMSGQMNLADMLDREIGEIVERRVAMVGRGNEDVVDIEQQSTTCPLDDATYEVCFAHRRLAENDIGGRIFKQDRPPDGLLYFVNVLADPPKRRFGVRQRQQIIAICGLMGRPGQMFRNQRRLIAFGKRAKALKMISIERLRTTDRHSNAVQ